MKPILAWHFLSESRMLRDRSMEVEAGYTYTYHDKPVLCRQGLHASVRAIDALTYAPGPIICRVKCRGAVVHGDDKLVCTERTVLWMADATTTLHEFACDVAEQALRRASVDDARCWGAIEAKRRWLAGEITDDDLAAAKDAARAAARDAARDAAWAAAKDAARAAAWVAARDAAWSAAWDAAWVAARDAARDAAWAAAKDAAWVAARDAAWSAAWDAARDAARAAACAAARDAACGTQNDILTARLEALA